MKKKRAIYSNAELQQILFPLLNHLQQRKPLHQSPKKNKTIIIGLQGGQGTGKTTLGNFLREQLQQKGFRVSSFSIDDYYTSAQERRELQKQYPHNPFYQISRGMPGTHRVSLMKKTLRRLKNGQKVRLPVFDKSLQGGFGDIARKTISIKERQDFVIFEGWCVGIPVVSSKMVVRVCQKNKIDLSGLDPSGQYHKVVLRQSKPYQQLWKYLDYIIMLKPDSSRLHLQWRLQQEQELRKRTGRRGMTNKEIEHFVQVYLPFTYVCYEKVRAEVVLKIDKKHHLYNARYI